jgi:NADP-reducing hydrogenase subunit HndC
MSIKVKRAMVLVSDDPESVQRGGRQVIAWMKAEIERLGLADEVEVSTISDIGRHTSIPMVIVYPEATVYGPVASEADVKLLVEEHLYKGRQVEGLLAPVKDLSGPIAWIRTRKGALPAEQRIVLRRAGLIDPESIDEYIASDGYEALGKALTQMTPQQVITELEESGLQGRGGAGFPTGRKWKFVSWTKSEKKYVICNADESEPGTFKDRLVLEGDPHAIVEAMAIAGYAVGANEGYIYVRGEYKLAQQRLQKAIEQALEYGLLGDNIFGTNFSFHIHVHAGAGAYVCGEETALIESIEGKRGEPRARPPYPTTNGLWGKPTLVNNVETLANVAPVVRNGAAWYRKFGTPSSPGTKVYTIMGNVNRTGVIEVPMGITLREVIQIYAGGMKNGATLRLAQTGGSSGSIVPASLQDTPMDFESFRKAGVSLGSGALLICDDNTCVVELAKVLLNFFRFESCGKCTPCRVGTHRTHHILTEITEGRGKLSDLDTLDYMVTQMDALSNCGLGQTAMVPVRDMLKHFRATVEAHINLGVCPAGVCPMTATETARELAHA